MEKKSGRIVGEVLYAAGDGATQRIPEGPCSIDAGSQDATISWTENEIDQVAALPMDTYTTYLTGGHIQLD